MIHVGASMDHFTRILNQSWENLRPFQYLKSLCHVLQAIPAAVFEVVGCVKWYLNKCQDQGSPSRTLDSSKIFYVLMSAGSGFNVVDSRCISSVPISMTHNLNEVENSQPRQASIYYKPA